MFTKPRPGSDPPPRTRSAWRHRHRYRSRRLSLSTTLASSPSCSPPLESHGEACDSGSGSCGVPGAQHQRGHKVGERDGAQVFGDGVGSLLAAATRAAARMPDAHAPPVQRAQANAQWAPGIWAGRRRRVRGRRSGVRGNADGRFW